MKARTKGIATGVAMVTLIGAGTGVSMDDDGDADEVDVAIVGPDLARASRVALDHLGEGRVTGTEAGDEESYYEVEVTLDDGSQVDVQLDRSFQVVGSEPDGRDDG